MMLNRRAVDLYGIVAIGVMIVMLALVGLKLVPRSFFMPMFYVAAALFLLRIILRVVLARQEGGKSAKPEEEKAP